jgi:hypothetical protein
VGDWVLSASKPVLPATYYFSKKAGEIQRSRMKTSIEDKGFIAILSIYSLMFIGWLSFVAFLVWAAIHFIHKYW